jgi:arylsulfatase A-like enzyme
MIQPFRFLLLILSLACTCGWSAERPAKPNVVIILADDLGWQDVKCYDIDEPSPLETPNMDRLAEQGVLFWQGYSAAPTCAPSRCAMMSGRHPAVTQKTHVVGGGPPTPYNVLQHSLMDPWYSGRMQLSEVTIAEALKANGYVSGHSGKWHMAISHNAFPQPTDQGFDFSRHELGVNRRMSPHRLTGFATSAADDPYQLDEAGFPRDQTTWDAIDFVQENKAKPFFLYYAAWLVHTPIHSRSKALLEKYCERLGVPFPSEPEGWTEKGQKNPYYFAMIESLDHYVGQLITYLDETEDPRWPGHMLRENTYIIFTSDNGGMEAHPGEIITDNAPLDKGKINAKEGGVRVPFIITGPKVPQGIESQVMINSLDLYPTILSLTGTAKPAEQALDGCDLSTLLLEDPTNPGLVVHPDGSMRNSMLWHFPHGVAQQSTLRVGGYKLIYNYIVHARQPELELYELYKTYPAQSVRGDIEEARNLAETLPEKAEQMRAQLFRELNRMHASLPYFNPRCKHAIANKEKVCTVGTHGKEGPQVWLNYEEHGAKVVQGQLAYTMNGGHRYEEWFITPARLEDGKLVANLPKGTTHYVFNLIDEHRFLVSYPELKSSAESGNGKSLTPYSIQAFKN